MSAGKYKFDRAVGLKVAAELCGFLKPACERLIVAGSLRRGKERVSDVEILYVSRIVEEKEGLFDVVKKWAADNVLTQLLDTGILEMRKNARGSTMWGAKNKLAVHVSTGMPVDFFLATESSWFNQLVCRTGPAELNVRICTAANVRGWTWRPYGIGFTHEDGKEFPVASEEDVFRFVRLPYMKPEERK